MTGMEPEAIERAAAAAWPSTEVEEQGGWLLRHTPGLDRARSNAALPIVPHPDPAVAERWYAARGAAARVQVAPLEERRALDATLAAAGWAESMRVDVLAAPAERVAASDAGHVVVRERATAEWLAAWALAEGRRDVAAHAALVFSQLPSSSAAYALTPDGFSVGMAILAPGGSCGVFCMATHPDARRRGLAGAVIAALARWAQERAAGLVFLQMLAANAPALALYARAGFERSHGYVHRLRA